MAGLNTWLRSIVLCLSLVSAINTVNVTKVYQGPRMGWIENFVIESSHQMMFIDSSTTMVRRVNIQHDVADIADMAQRDGVDTVQGLFKLERGRVVVIGVKCQRGERFACSRGASRGASYLYTLTAAPDPMVLPVVKRVQMILHATGLNGMTSLDGRELILVADSLNGGLWGMNLATGQHKFIWSDTTMRGTATNPNGISGVRVHRNVLYYTNTAMGTFHSVSIDKMGRPIADPTVIASGLIGIEDFELDLDREMAYACHGGQGNRIVQIHVPSGHVTTVCRLRGPTAVHWVDKAKRVLYASTNGYDGLSKTGGGLYRIDLF